jgi:hypothetical protein
MELQGLEGSLWEDGLGDQADTGFCQIFIKSLLLIRLAQGFPETSVPEFRAQ